jgi:branched-chain amino acid transport system substrate-binding protein
VRKKTKRLGFILMIVATVALTGVFHIPEAFAGTVPGVTDDTILIGLLCPLSGPAAIFGKQCADLPEALYREFGQNIHGRKIKVIRVDEGCDPVKAIAGAKRLIYDDKVFFLNGPACSNSVLAVKPIIAQTGTPTFSQGSPADAIVNPIVKSLFNPGISSTGVAKAMVDFAMTIPGVKRIGVIRHTDEWASAIYKPMIKYMKERYNVSPVADVVTERGVADVTPQVLKLKAANVDVVLAPIYVAETSAFIRDAYKLGLKVPIVGASATTVADQYESLKTLLPLKKYFSPSWAKYPLDNPKVKVYEALMKKYFPDKKFDGLTICTVEGVNLVLDALKKCGRDLTQEKFINILETNYTNWGPKNYIWASPIRFSKTSHQGMDSMLMSTIVTGKTEIVKTYADYEKLIKK